MSEPSYLAGLHAAARRYGKRELAQRSARLLETGEEDDDFLRAVGGAPASGVIDGSWPRYWARSWGARALEHYWVESAAPSVIRALGDEHWRVRMLSCRVVEQHELGVPEKIAALCADDSWRVRDAAARALGAVGESEHARLLRDLEGDEKPEVSSRAQRSLEQLAERLDRSVDDLLAG